MKEIQNKRVAGILFFCAAGAFIIAGLLTNHAMWFGVAALDFVVGILYLRQARGANARLDPKNLN